MLHLPTFSPFSRSIPIAARHKRFYYSKDLRNVSILVRQQRVSRSIVPIGRIGAGLNYNFNYNVGVYAMPVLQYQLQSQLKEEFRNSRSWQTTLEIGVRMFVDPR
jgi:hypothetical protein